MHSAVVADYHAEVSSVSPVPSRAEDGADSREDDHQQRHLSVDGERDDTGSFQHQSGSSADLDVVRRDQASFQTSISDPYRSFADLDMANQPDSLQGENADFKSNYYVDSIEQNDFMPSSHLLRSLAKGHTFDAIGKLSCYDIGRTDSELRLVIEMIDSFTVRGFHDVKRFWRSSRSKSKSTCRVVVVEDLSPTLINLLGSALDLHPLVFIRHLRESRLDEISNRRGQVGLSIDSYLDDKILSLRWYRPANAVIRSTALASFKQAKRGGVGLEFNDIGDWPAYSQVRAKEFSPFNNTMRKEWIVGTNAAGKDAEGSVLVAASWLEKITIYREQRGGNEFR
jgi:hypothetical protein